MTVKELLQELCLLGSEQLSYDVLIWGEHGCRCSILPPRVEEQCGGPGDDYKRKVVILPSGPDIE
jgi:hypothetical protein